MTRDLRSCKIIIVVLYSFITLEKFHKAKDDRKMFFNNTFSQIIFFFFSKTKQRFMNTFKIKLLDLQTIWIRFRHCISISSITQIMGDHSEISKSSLYSNLPSVSVSVASVIFEQSSMGNLKQIARQNFFFFYNF